MNRLSTQRTSTRDRGFTLVEVMVAVVVICVGLLGIAKMQALALSSTGNARERSLAALQAAGLASAMRADRAYWANMTVARTITVTTTPTPTVTVTAAPADTSLAASASSATCVVLTSCSVPGNLAYADLQDWGTQLATSLANSSATITCSVPTTAVPASCTITLNWTENVVQLNTGTATSVSASANANALAATAPTSYTLFVNP